MYTSDEEGVIFERGPAKYEPTEEGLTKEESAENDPAETG